MNTVAKWETTARVNNPERLEIWRSIVGGDVFPIKSLIPVMGGVDGFDEPQRFYLLDMEALNTEQHGNLIKALSDKSGIDDVNIQSLLDKYGVPILAADVTVSTTRNIV